MNGPVFEEVDRRISEYHKMKKNNGARLYTTHMEVNIIKLIRDSRQLIDSKEVSGSKREELVSFLQEVSADDPGYATYIAGATNSVSEGRHHHYFDVLRSNYRRGPKYQRGA